MTLSSAVIGKDDCRIEEMQEDGGEKIEHSASHGPFQTSANKPYYRHLTTET